MVAAVPAAEIGAGTVLTVEEVARVKAAGGTLVVSPNCDVEVIAATRAVGMASWPGVMTPTECFAAIKAGATGLKLFPGSLIGPEGLKAIRAVLPKDLAVYAVGGAGPTNFAEWVKAGANGFGIGTALFTPGLCADDIHSRAVQIVAAHDAVFA
jgi:2-dehydro-3-deoxyphosphogalactonate aldolase